MAQFEFADHPGGGVELRIAAADREELFRACGSALCLYLRDVGGVEPRQSHAIVVDGYNEKTACVALLNELLVRMETGGLAFARYECTGVEEVSGAGGRRQLRVHGRALGEPADTARHRVIRPVRCARVDGLRLRRDAGALELTCVLDA